MLKGKFITFEGIDGSGKTTHTKLLASYLQDLGHKVVQTREPGGTLGAEEIRALLVSGESNRWSPETEILLFKAARRDHLEKLIRPALESGKYVVSDRFVDSTRVYQGVVRGSGRKLRALVDSLHDLVIGQNPDLTIIIDVNPEVVQKRTVSQLKVGGEKFTEKRFEDMGLQFQHDLRQGFIKLAEEYNQRCVLVDGNGSPEEVFSKICKIVNERVLNR